MKKQLKLIVIIVAVTAVLALAWWGISLIPNENQGVTSGVSQTVDLYEVDRANIVTVSVKNPTDEYLIKCENGTTYQIETLEEFPLYTSRVSSIVSAMAEVKAKRMVEENPEDLEKYGLSTPKTVVTLTDKSNNTHTLKVGDEAPSGGYYFLYNDSPAVYTISLVSAEAFLYDRFDLVDVYLTPTSEEIPDLTFDKITLAGSVREEPIVIELNDPDAEDVISYFAYSITSPAKANFDSNNGNTFLNGLVSGYAERAEVFNPTEEDLEKYGFNNPYSTLELVVGGKVYQVIVGSVDEEGNVYAMRPDRDIIYKTTEHGLTWLKTQYQDLVDRLFLTPYIAEVSNVQVSFPDVTYDFETDYTEETDLTVKYKGKTLNPDVFKCFYQVLVTAYYENYTLETPSGETVMTLTYTYRDGRTDTLDLFASVENPRQVIIVLNGKPTKFSMRYNFVEKVKKDCVNAIEGNEIVTDW